MQEPDLHDLSDDADYAASFEQGSASMMTVMRSDSGRSTSSSVPEGAEVVYLKDNVTIHPTQYASERISGRLKLIKQGSSLFMTWIPYKEQSTNARLSDRDRSLYTIRAVPFTDVRSIRRFTRTLGWQYIIVVLSSGLAFPSLYFYNGGVKELLATIKQHVFIVSPWILREERESPCKRERREKWLGRPYFGNVKGQSLCQWVCLGKEISMAVVLLLEHVKKIDQSS